MEAVQPNSPVDEDDALDTQPAESRNKRFVEFSGEDILRKFRGGGTGREENDGQDGQPGQNGGCGGAGGSGNSGAKNRKKYKNWMLIYWWRA